MTALEEAVMGFAAEETVLTLEAAALFLAALLTAVLVLVLLSVVVVGTSATTEPVSFAPLAVTSAETTILEESLVSMVGAEMETPAGSRLFIVATASLAALVATATSVVPLMVALAEAAVAFRASMLL